MSDEFDTKNSYSPITSDGTGATEYREHSLVADGTSERVVPPTAGSGCVRCQRHISSGTLTEEEFREVKRDGGTNKRFDRETTDRRGPVKSAELVADEIAGRREAALLRKVCPNCHYVHGPELVLDKARFSGDWYRISPTYFRALVSDLKEKIRRVINRFKVSKTH